MRHFCKLGTSILVGVAVAVIAFWLKASPAYAQDAKTNAKPVAATTSTTQPAAVPVSTTQPADAAKTAKHPAGSGKRYFVEFRGRNAASYGHLYILYGEVNSHNEIIRSEIAGFHPAGDANDCDNCSVVNWTLGHLVPVPGEMGASDGDLEEKYVTARYRIMLSVAQYRKLAAYIKKRKAEKTEWHALFNNCVGFGKEVAEFLELKIPVFIWLEPKEFVEQLRDRNGGQPQQALRDASGSLALPASVKPAAPKATSPAAPTAVSPTPRKPKKQPVASN